MIRLLILLTLISGTCCAQRTPLMRHTGFVIHDDTIDIYVLDGENILFRRHATNQLIHSTDSGIPIGMRTRYAHGDIIDSIEWLVLIDSTQHLVMDRSIRLIVQINHVWVDSGLISYDREPSEDLLKPLKWYFCKRKGSQTIIINPKP